MVSIQHFTKAVLGCLLLVSLWCQGLAIINLKLTPNHSISINQDVIAKFHNCLCGNALHRCVATLMYRLTGRLLYMDLSDLSSITNHFTEDPWRGRYLRPYNCVLQHRFFPHFAPPTLACTQQPANNDTVDECERFGACQFFYVENGPTCDFNCVGIRGINSGFFHMTLYYSPHGKCGTYQARMGRRLPTTARTPFYRRTGAETSVLSSHSQSGRPWQTRAEALLQSMAETETKADKGRSNSTYETALNTPLTSTFPSTETTSEIDLPPAVKGVIPTSTTLPYHKPTVLLSKLSAAPITSTPGPGTLGSNGQATLKVTDTPSAVPAAERRSNLLVKSVVSATTTFRQTAQTSRPDNGMSNDTSHNESQVMDVSILPPQSSTHIIDIIPQNVTSFSNISTNTFTPRVPKTLSTKVSSEVMPILITLGVLLVLLTLLALALLVYTKRKPRTREVGTQYCLAPLEREQSCHSLEVSNPHCEVVTVDREDVQYHESDALSSPSRHHLQEGNSSITQPQTTRPKGQPLQRQCSDVMAAIASSKESTYIKNERDDLTLTSAHSSIGVIDYDTELTLAKNVDNS